MKGRFQWREEITIDARPDEVWRIVNDVSLIPRYHPEVDSVDLLDGHPDRRVGSRYRCNVSHGRGKGSCIEEVVGSVPGVSVSTFMGTDTWGIGRILKDFVVDSTLIPRPGDRTVLRFDAYYNPAGFFNRVLNILVFRRKTRQRSRDVMCGIKRLVEQQSTGAAG